MDEQTIRLVLQITDSGSIDEAVAKLGLFRGTVKAVADEYQIADQRGDQFVVSTKDVSHALDQETAAAVEATMAHRSMSLILKEQAEQHLVTVAAASREAADALGSGTGRGGKVGFGRAALQAQYAMDDFAAVYKDGGFSRAIASMQNNIPQIALSLGATGGLTAAIGAVAIGIGLATPVVKKFWDEWTGHPEGEIKKMEELEKKMDEFRKRAGMPTPAEAKAEKQVQAAFSEGGFDKIAKGLAETLGVSGRADAAKMTPDEKREFESAEALSHPLLGLASEAQLRRSAETKKRIQDQVTARNLARAKQLMVDAGATGKTGAGARDTLKALIDANPGAFPAGLLGDIESADPADVKRQQGLEDQGALNIENMARDKKEKATKEAEAHKAIAARQKANHDRIMAEAKFFDDKDKADADAAKAKADLDEEVRRAEIGARQGAHEIEEAEAREAKQAKTKADAAAKHEVSRARREAMLRLRETSEAIDRRAEDVEYWNKVNSGMITMQEQLARQKSILQRQVQDQQRRLQQSMVASSLDN